MKKFKMLMGFLSPLIVLIVAVVCVGGIFAAMQQKISMRNDFIYEKHIGSGTEEDPYLIYSIGILDKDGNAEKGSFNYYAGANKDGINFFTAKNETIESEYNHFRQVQDIVPESGEKVLETGFDGYYNAYGRNITINNTLFSKVGFGNKKASIKNLNILTSKSINAPAGLTEELYANLENVTFQGSIANTTKDGKIFEYAGGNGLIAGGLATKAYSGATLKMCRNLGSVSGANLAGGLIGYIERTADSSVQISYSYNKGTVKTTASGLNNFVGGLVGYNNAGLNISDSYNSGILESHATNSVGGMLGSNKAVAHINRTYSLISGNGSKALIADGNLTSGTGNVEYNFSDNSGTILGASNGTVNDLQNLNSYAGWNFAGSEEDLENNWVMAFGAVALKDSGKTVNLYLPHLWYEVEGLQGEFKLNYVAGENTIGSVPQTKSYTKKNANIQIEKNINNLARNGYIFLGWSTFESAEDPLFYQNPEGKMPEILGVYSLLEEVSLYPVWKVETYSLFFQANDGNWDLIPDGFVKQSDGSLKYEYTVEENISFPTEQNISRTGFIFEGFEITYISEKGVAITKNSGVEQEAGVGTVCLNFVSGTHGSIILKAKWQGQQDIKYKVVYHLANKVGNFNEADGEVLKYIFETTGVSGSTFSKTALDLIDIGGKTLRVYDPNKSFGEMQLVSDNELAGKIKTHFEKIYDLSTTSKTNIIEGDGSTIVTVRVERNLYSISLTAGENIYRVRMEGEKEEKFGNVISLQTYYDSTLSIFAELEQGYIFNDWKNADGSVFSGAKDIVIDSVASDLDLTASAIGGYTIEIYANNPYAKLNEVALIEFVEALEDYEKVNYEIKADGTVVISNRRLGYNQIIPLSEGIGNNTLYSITFGIDDMQIPGLTLVGFSLDKFADPMYGQDYNKELIVGEFEPNEIQNADKIKLYAIWSEPKVVIKLDLNNADATKPESDVIEIRDAVVPNKLIDILEGQSISSLGYDLRAGFTFSGWKVISSNSIGFTTGEILTSNELENKDIYSDVELQAIWSGNQTVYIVEYKTQNLDGETYSLSNSAQYNSTAGNEVFVSNFLRDMSGFEFENATIKENATAEEILLEEDKFELLGNKNQVLTIYLDRIVYQISLLIDESELGVESVSFTTPDAEGIVSIEGTVARARYGTELTASADLKEGFSWKAWQTEAGETKFIEQNATFDVREDIVILPTTHFKFRIAFANEGASKNSIQYIKADMCERVDTLPSGVMASAENGSDYILVEAFDSGATNPYNASKYIKFPLYQLKAEYDACQYQTGWQTENGEALIRWNENGTIELNRELKFENIIEANQIIVLYATWSEKEYSVEINYDSSEQTNSIYSQIAPFKPSIVETPTKTGYNFLEYYAEVQNGANFEPVTNFDATTFVVTKNTKIQALWTAEGTKTRAQIEVEIGKSEGGYQKLYLAYESNQNKWSLSTNSSYIELPTDTEIDLDRISDWLKEMRGVLTNPLDYELKYFTVLGENNVLLYENIVTVKPDGSLRIIIRFDLKTVLVRLVIAENSHVQKVGFDASLSATIREFYIGKRIYLYAKVDDGYSISTWKYEYSAQNINNSKYAISNEEAFYFDVPSGTSEVIVVPETEANEYEITYDIESTKDATMASGDSINIQRILGNRENIYTIENSQQFNLQNLKKTGYKFLGFSAEFSSGKVYTMIGGNKVLVTSGDIISNIAVGSYGNINLVATFVANKYVLTFAENRSGVNTNDTITIPTETITVEYGQAGLSLGVATIDNDKFGFRGWSLVADLTNAEVVADRNGNCPIWEYHKDSWAKTEGVGGDTYAVTLYAVWVEFPYTVEITGDIDKIEKITITTIKGDSNAKLVRNLFASKYEIYLNVKYIVKIEVEMIDGYKVRNNPADSWLAGDGTKWTWSANCTEDPIITHTGSNFEIDVTSWIGPANSDIAEIRFSAEEMTYTLSYDLNFSFVGAEPAQENSKVQTRVLFGSNNYVTQGSSLSRPLTPSEIEKLVSYVDSEDTFGLVPRGYSFLGWYVTPNCLPGDEIMYYNGSSWSYSNWTTAGDATLYAKWVEQEYVVDLYNNYKVSDDSIFGIGNVEYNHEIGGWKVPTRTGYTFLGWFKDRDLTIKLTDANGMSIGVDWTWSDASELVAYAGWEAETYKLYALEDSAHNNDLQTDENRSEVIQPIVSGYPTGTISVIFDSAYTIGVVPTRTGYNFLGWFVVNAEGVYVQITNADGSAKEAFWNLDLGSDDDSVEMFAKWEQKAEGINVTVKNYYENLSGDFVGENAVVKKLLADNDLTEEMLIQLLAEEREGYYTEIGRVQIEFKFFRNSQELLEPKTQIAYADGSLYVEIRYYKIRLTLDLEIDSAERISEISYQTNGLVDENFKETNTRKYAIVRYGATITLTAVIKDGAEFIGWYDLFNKASFDKTTFSITEKMKLQAQSEWIQYKIIYRDCELPNATYTFASLPMSLPEIKRIGFDFLGFKFDICEDNNCTHTTCEKYYNTEIVDRVFSGKIIIGGEEERVSIPAVFNGEYVSSIGEKAKGSLVLRAHWNGTEGIQFKVVIHEQNLNGEYGFLPEKVLYGTAGLEVKASNKNSLVAHDGDYVINAYTGTSYYIFNLKTTWVSEAWVENYYIFMEYTDYYGQKHLLSDYISDSKNPTADEFASAFETATVMGNETSVIHIFKQRKQQTISMNIVDSISKFYPFKTLSLNAKDGNKVLVSYFTNSATVKHIEELLAGSAKSSLSLIDSNGKLIGEDISFVMFYGGSYSLTIQIENGFEYELEFKSGTNNVDLGANYVVSGNEHTLLNTTTLYSSIELYPTTVQYKIKVELQDNSYALGSTLAELPNGSNLEIVEDEDGNYIEFAINATTDEIILLEDIAILRDGYKLNGFIVSNIHSSTGNLFVRFGKGETEQELTAPSNNLIYSILPSVYGDENEYILVLQAKWQANIYEVGLGYDLGTYEYKEFTFDEGYLTSPEDILKALIINHEEKLSQDLKFLGWFKEPQTEADLELVNKDFKDVTSEEKQEILEKYLFGIKAINGKVDKTTGKNFNILYNLGSYLVSDIWATDVSDMELYLINNSNKYINSVSSIEELAEIEEMYAWYIDNTFAVNFDLNLPSIIPDATTELAYFAGDTGTPKQTNKELRWKPDNKSSQVFPTVNLLNNWGKVIAWSLTANGKPGDAGYYAISETDTYINADITRESIVQKTLYAIYEGNSVSVTYNFNIGETTVKSQVYTETNKALFKPSFKVTVGGTSYDLTKENIITILGTEAVKGGIGLGYYSLRGFKLKLNAGQTTVSASTNEDFILLTDIDKINSLEFWKEKYVVAGNITFEAIWDLNAVKVVYHANYASDVDISNLEDEDLLKYYAYNLNEHYEIYGFNAPQINFVNSVSGMFVGWATSSDALVPDVVTYIVGNQILADTAKEIHLYAIWKGSVDNPFEISNTCEFNYLAGSDCRGESISYRSYLASFNAFESTTLFYFEFIENIVESEKCGNACTATKFVATSLINARVKAYKDENNNSLYDEGEAIRISKTNSTSGLFDRISNSFVEGFEIEIEATAITQSIASNIENSTIKNITINDNLNKSKEYIFVSNSIIAKGVQNSNLENITNNVNIQASNSFSNAGLFATIEDSNLNNIVNNGDLQIDGTGTGYAAIAHSLINNKDVTIKNIVNNGNIVSGHTQILAGLFVGVSGSNATILQSVHNNGNISVDLSEGNIIGGLVGKILGNLNFEQSSNSGDIIILEEEKKTTVIAGGFVGLVQEEKSINILESYNTGVILDNSYSGNFSYSSILGGFIGYAKGSILVSNSYVTSKIVSETTENGVSFAGGFVGYAEDTGVLIRTSYSMADLKAKYNSGFATVNMGALNVTNSFYENTLVLGNYLTGGQNGKTRSDMQKYSTYSSWSFVNVGGTRNSESWLRKDSSTLAASKVRVGGYDGLYSLPRLWWEELHKANDSFKVIYVKNDGSAELINYSGSSGNYVLTSAGSISVPNYISYDNENGNILDSNSYTSGNCVVSTLAGTGYKIIDSAENDREETTFAWWKKTAYDFIGFSLDPTATEEKDLIGDKLLNIYYSGDLYLYAVWAPMSYRITYLETKGVQNPNQTSYVVGKEVVLQPLGNANGYRFKHWENANGEVVTTLPVGTSGNQTLTAIWDYITYTVTFDLNTDFDADYEQGSDIKTRTYNISNVSSLNSVLSTTTTTSLNGKFGVSLNTSLYEFRFFKIVSISSSGVESKIYSSVGGSSTLLSVGDVVDNITTGSFGEFKVIVVWAGDKDAPYEIPDLETFNLFADNGFFDSEKQYHFKQTADIEVKAGEILSSSHFSGVYDGQGKTISFAEGKNQSVFKTVGSTTNNSATIKNLNIDFKTSNFQINYMIDGLFADILYGTLENISINGTVTVTGDINHFGNIGYAYEGAQIIGFRNYANITINSSTHGAISTINVGGIVGLVEQANSSSKGFTIQNSSNEGNIALTKIVASSVGGLIGYFGSDSTDDYLIKDCYNMGNITATAAYVGGITGSQQGSTSKVINCYNTGTISTAGYAGNAAGISAMKVGSISYSYNIGSTNAGSTKGGIYAVGSSSDDKDLNNFYVAGSSTNSYDCGTSTSLNNLQLRSIYESKKWTFGTSGTAEEGWVFVTAKVKVDGVEKTISLPRLAFEWL